jgi:AcrR family transcriptional regulator
MPKDTFFNLDEIKRQRIVDAAIEEFSRLHYDKVTINGIVNNAGIPKGSFYQYFENKDDLYIYLFTSIASDKMNLFDSLKTKINDLGFRDYMMEYILLLKKAEVGNDRMLKLKKEFLEQCPQHIKKEILKREMPRSLNSFREIIISYVEKGEFKKDLNTKTAAYVTVMGISNLEHYNFEKTDNILDVLSSIIEFLENGMT